MKKKLKTATPRHTVAYIKKVPCMPNNLFQVGTILQLTKRLKLSKIPRSPLPKDRACEGRSSPFKNKLHSN